MTNINVIIKRPGEAPLAASVPNALDTLQELVGGAIEVVTLCSDFAVICNEDGRLIGLPHNCKVCNLDFVGTVVFAGVAGDDFTDAPCNVEMLGRLLPSIYENK